MNLKLKAAKGEVETAKSEVAAAKAYLEYEAKRALDEAQRATDARRATLELGARISALEIVSLTLATTLESRQRIAATAREVDVAVTNLSSIAQPRCIRRTHSLQKNGGR